MLRSAALAIVLTLTATPVVGLVCKTVCASPVAAMPSCHRQAPAASDGVTAAHDCDLASLLAMAVLPADGRARGASRLDAVTLPSTSAAAPALTAPASAADGADTGPPHERRPVSLVLRI